MVEYPIHYNIHSMNKIKTKSIHFLPIPEMKRKRIFLSCLILLTVMNLFGQRVDFVYDDSGNRDTTKIVIVEQLKSNSVTFPVVNPKSLQSTENALAGGPEEISGSQNENQKSLDNSSNTSIKQEEGEIITLIYPNPSKGLIKIDISNIPLNSITEMKLYDLSGLEKSSKRNFESHSEIDISQLKDGIYILRIKINEKIFDWKIVKTHD
jgi:hypothetical protein